MARGKFLTDRIKERIVKLNEAGLDQVEIAYHLNISQNSVSRTLKKHRETK